MGIKYLAKVPALLFCMFFLTSSVAVAADNPEISYDGLVRKHDAKAAAVYVKPGADFSIYKRVRILDVYIAFKKDWQREHRGVTKNDMERIKRRLAEMFREVFVDVLEKGGYPVVYEDGDDVLLIRPAIIDLDITAPDVMTAGRSRTYVTSAGAATLYIELYDSTTGEILARAIDRKSGRNYGSWRMSSSVTNSAEARRILKQWARMLKEGLDRAEGKRE
jgi:hypothetical protein